jgi:hypothetical protein
MTGKSMIYALIAVGFVCMLGAHLVGTMAADPNANFTVIASFLFTAAGTAAFIFAGITAVRMLRGR